jgi:prevent-host-death family protein
MEVNVHEAKTHLSRLLKRVAAGEEITISRAGMPVAKLIATPVHSGKVRLMGMDRGKIWMAENFDQPDAKLEALFSGPITTETPERSARPKRKRKT